MFERDDWAGELRDLTLGRLLTERSQQWGDKPCLFFLHDNSTITYRQLEEAANRLANGLKAAGFGRGSHVGVLTENRPEQLITYFALGKIGAVCVPVNTAVKGYFLERFVGHSDSVAIIMEPEFLETLGEVASTLPALETLILLRSLSDGPACEIPASLSDRRVLTFDEVAKGADTLVDEAEPLELAVSMMEIYGDEVSSGRGGGICFSVPAPICGEGWGIRTGSFV